MGPTGEWRYRDFFFDPDDLPRIRDFRDGMVLVLALVNETSTFGRWSALPLPIVRQGTAYRTGWAGSSYELFVLVYVSD